MSNFLFCCMSPKNAPFLFYPKTILWPSGWIDQVGAVRTKRSFASMSQEVIVGPGKQPQISKHCQWSKTKRLFRTPLLRFEDCLQSYTKMARKWLYCTVQTWRGSPNLCLLKVLGEIWMDCASCLDINRYMCIIKCIYIYICIDYCICLGATNRKLIEKKKASFSPSSLLPCWFHFNECGFSRFLNLFDLLSYGQTWHKPMQTPVFMLSDCEVQYVIYRHSCGKEIMLL